MGDPVVFRNGD